MMKRLTLTCEKTARALWLVAALCVAAVGAVGCSDENNCSLAGRPMVNCRLVSNDPATKKQKEYVVEHLSVTTPGVASPVINSDTQVKSLKLPLSYTADSTRFLLHYFPDKADAPADTLVVVHQNRPFFQSVECGYQVKQTILSARVGVAKNVDQPHKIIAVEVTNKEANTQEIDNLIITFKHRETVSPQ